MRIRRLRRADWSAMRRIYLEGLATGQGSFETKAPSWKKWDGAHRREARLVVEEHGRILGWAALSSVSARKVYRGVAEVSIYVGEDARGRGVGRALLAALIRASEKAGIWTLQAGIFPENTPSLAIHRRCGFRLVGRRERIGRHGKVWRDVLLFERRSRKVG